MRPSRHLAVLACAAVLAAACGGGDDVDPEADEDAAEAAIEALIAELEDQGFAEDPDEDDDEDTDDLEFESEECQEFDEAFPDEEDGFPGETAREETGQYAGGDFETEGGQSTIEAGVAFVEGEDDLDLVFEVLGDDRLPDCFVEAMELGIEEDEDAPGVENLGFELLDDPSVGDEATAFAVTGEILGFPFVAEVSFARDGRVAAYVNQVSVGDAAGPDAEDVLELLLDEAEASES